MTTISGNSIPSAGAGTPGSVPVTSRENYLGKPRAMTAEEKVLLAPVMSKTHIPIAGADVPESVPVPVTRRENYLGKPRAMTAEEKVLLAPVMSKTNTPGAEAAEGMENHQMSLPNVSDLSLENAKKSLSIAQAMIDRKEDVGMTVSGHYGDKDISDLPTYTAALVDYIGKFEAAVSKAAVGGATAPSQASTAAASHYRQMQGMAGDDGKS